MKNIENSTLGGMSRRSARGRALLAVVAVLLGLTPAAASIAPGRPALITAPAAPNIVLILIDDAAWMDLGAFGGEASTPNIDRLAARGAILTNYHTSPLCSPSRAMLLTGVDNHQTGVATIEEVLPPEHAGKPGYSLSFEPGVLTVADRLKAEGYRTLMVGKWHLGHSPGDLPNSHGFDRSLALDASGADNWAAKSYMPYYKDAPWFQDGQRVRMPEDYYSSELFVDRMIDYIDQGKPSQPWFAYLAFQAVHIPVQAPREYSDRYKGRFDQGWEALRDARWQRAKQQGLIPADAKLSPLPASSRPWASLTEDERRIYARSMEVYSGMLEAMDHHIGRLVAHVEARGELDNTIFVVTSDNGPEPSDPVHATGMNLWMPLNGYEWTLDTLGERGSLGFIGPEWAASVSSPNHLYKFYASEGGLRVPFVISGKGVPAGRRITSNAFVTDVTPTLLDLAGVSRRAPEGTVPMIGRSLVPVLEGTQALTYGPDDVIGVEVSGNAALFRGALKIVRNIPPGGDGRWRLYDMARDPGETTDLSTTRPDVLASMVRAYDDYAARSGVLPLPEGYESEAQIMRNSIHRQLGFYGGGMALIVGIVLAGAVLFLGRPRRSRPKRLDP